MGVVGQSPMIRTNHGPVGLRQPRKPEVIKPAIGEKKDVKVFKNWLASKKGSKAKDDAKSDAYRTLIKQSMLLAAAKMEIDDIAYGSPGVAIDEKTGLYRSPEEMQERDGLARVKIATLQDGTAAIPDGRHVGTGKLKKTSRALTRHLLVKTSKYPWGWYKYRYWTLQSGIMRVYRADGAEYAGERHKLYNIREATCRFETKDMVGIQEPFLPRYEARVRLLLKERAWGPVFLYSKDVSEVKSWERAIRMSKYLLNATDREAMAFVIGRVAGSIMTKGWNALSLGPSRLFVFPLQLPCHPSHLLSEEQQEIHVRSEVPLLHRAGEHQALDPRPCHAPHKARPQSGVEQGAPCVLAEEPRPEAAKGSGSWGRRACTVSASYHITSLVTSEECRCGCEDAGVPSRLRVASHLGAAALRGAAGLGGPLPPRQDGSDQLPGCTIPCHGKARRYQQGRVEEGSTGVHISPRRNCFRSWSDLIGSPAQGYQAVFKES